MRGAVQKAPQKAQEPRWRAGRGKDESEIAWNRRNALALQSGLYPKHCCVCSGVCFHTGSPSYCPEHARCTCRKRCEVCKGAL